MNNYVIVLDDNPEDWQLWAAANLQRLGLIVCQIDYPHNTPKMSFQQKIEAKNCGVSVRKEWIENINYSKVIHSDCAITINLCMVPANILKKIFGKSIRIWDVCYHNYHIASLSHIGEHEQQHNYATIPISLIEDSKKVIEVAAYPIHFSAVRNYFRVVFSIYLLIIKAINANSKNFCEYKKNSDANYCKAKYLISFYYNIALKIWRSLSNKLFGVYNEQWTIGLSNGSFLKEGISNLKVVPMPRNEFWADPFLYCHKMTGRNYLFIERFPFKDKKGVLACGEIDKNLNVQNMHDILERDYHFSFPHLIEEDGQLYMMPECSANRRLEVFRCVEFPDKWELYSTSMEGENLADTVYYRDKNGDSWIFTAQSDTSVDLHCTLMNIYKVDSLEFKEVVPHRMNPIILNARFSRNGGRIYEENGKVYRVAQDNTHGRYGYGISVREITKLSIDEYEEKEVRYQKGEDISGFIGTHQMCQIDGMFVMDLRKK